MHNSFFPLLVVKMHQAPNMAGIIVDHIPVLILQFYGGSLMSAPF